MDRPHCALVFALGCIGALAEEIVRLYQLRGKPPKYGFSSWYFFISGVYAALGGVLAVALPTVSTIGALYAGITLPLTISTVARRKRTLIQLANSAEWTPPPKERREFSELLRTHANGIFSQSDQDA